MSDRNTRSYREKSYIALAISRTYKVGILGAPIIFVLNVPFGKNIQNKSNYFPYCMNNIYIVY